MGKCILYQMTSDKKSYHKNKTKLAEVNCEYKQPIDIVNPVVIIKGKFINCNYLYLEDFNRYYFVRKPIGICDDLISFECHCDVLSSNNILQLQALVERQEFKRNTQLVDNQMVLQSNTNFFAKQVGNQVIADYNIFITTCGGGE